MAESLITLAQVIGKNVKKLRAENTLEELAAHGRRIGANWSAASVRAIERGEFRATIETVAILALALDRLRESGTIRGQITSRQLFESDEPIALGRHHATGTDQLLRFLGGDTSGTVLNEKYLVYRMQQGVGEFVEKSEKLNLPDQSIDLYERVEESGPETPAESRLAKKIDIDIHELRSWSVHLWGKSFENHRDDIAGPDSTPQKKGRVSRELLEEIATAMKGKKVGND